MKFDCDIHGIRKEARHDKLMNWHKHFAFLPCKVGPHDCRWLEFVDRKGETYVGRTALVGGGGYMDVEKWRWEYKARYKLIK